jgi:hypothetical protein
MVDGIGDGHFHAFFLRQFISRFSRIHAFYHHADFLYRFLRFLSFTDQKTAAAIPGMLACAGHDQIAGSGQPCEGLLLRSQLFPSRS